MNTHNRLTEILNWKLWKWFWTKTLQPAHQHNSNGSWRSTLVGACCTRFSLSFLSPHFVHSPLPSSRRAVFTHNFRTSNCTRRSLAQLTEIKSSHRSLVYVCVAHKVQQLARFPAKSNFHLLNGKEHKLSFHLFHSSSESFNSSLIRK